MARNSYTKSTKRVGTLTGTTGEFWPDLLDATYQPLLQDTGAWAVVGVDLGANCVHGDRTYIFFGDVVPQQGTEPFEGSDCVAWTDDEFVVQNGGHQPMGLHFKMPLESHATDGEPGWRYCTECRALFRPGTNFHHCVATVDHRHREHPALKFRVPFEPTTVIGQAGWRKCSRCALMFFPRPQNAPPIEGCPAGGAHLVDPAIRYVLPTIGEGEIGAVIGAEIAPPESGRPDWRYCVRCDGLFWNGEPHKGICAGAGGGGIRLHVVSKDGRYDPFVSSDPVGQIKLAETPNAAFSWEGRVYVCAGFAEPRPGDPAAGQYVCSKVDPAEPGEFCTEFMLSPRIGCCAVGDSSQAAYELRSHVPFGPTFMLERVGGETTPRNAGWRLCKECDTLYWSPIEGPAGQCQKTGPHQPRTGLEFTLNRGIAADQAHQTNWRQCRKCHSAFRVDPQLHPADTGRCPGGGFHTEVAGREFGVRHAWRAEDATNERGWRFCRKCHALFFDRRVGGDKEVCPGDPARGEHEALGREFVLPHSLGGSPFAPFTHRDEWRKCKRCFALFYDGGPDKGHCANPVAPNQVGHVKADDNREYSLPFGTAETPDNQSNWRFCNKCFCVFYAPYANGVCPKDHAPHSPTDWVFQLPSQAGIDPDRSFRFCQQCRCLVRHDHWIDIVTGHALDDGQFNWAAWLTTTVVVNSDHPVLARLLTRTTHANGVVMLGYDGYYFRLAWMPLFRGGKPRYDTIRYYHRGKDAWTDKPDLSPGSELFVNEGVAPWRWTHVSAKWIAEIERWIVVYQKSDEWHDKLPIVARTSRDLRDWSAEFVLFDPVSAQGTYMHYTDAPAPFYGKLPPTLKPPVNANAYGAFILDRYTVWDRDEPKLDLYYLLSTWAPYQVHLMHSQVHIELRALIGPLQQMFSFFQALLRQFGRLLGRFTLRRPPGT